MENKLEIYNNLIKATSLVMSENSDKTSAEYIEACRIYHLAVINCINLYLSSKDKEKIGLCFLEQSNVKIDAKSTESELFLIFTNHKEERFICEKEFVKQHFTEAEYCILVPSIEEEIVEKPMDPEPEPEPLPEIEEKEELSVPMLNEPETMIDLSKVQTVETVEVTDNKIDYSSVIAKQMAENEEKKHEEKRQQENVPKPDKIEPLIPPVTSTFEEDIDINKKRKDTFFYDRYLINVGSMKFGIHVYPYAYGENEPISTNIFVTVKDINNHYRGYISQFNGNKNITITCNNCRFIVRASWKHKVFSSTIKLLDSTDEAVNIEKKEVRPEQAAKSTHMIIEKANNKYHVFPASFVNDRKTGLCGSVVFNENTQSVFIPNSFTQVSFEPDAELYETYWEGNDIPVLVCEQAQEKQ